MGIRVELGLLLVRLFAQRGKVQPCFKARYANTGTHDGNIVKGQVDVERDSSEGDS